MTPATLGAPSVVRTSQVAANADPLSSVLRSAVASGSLKVTVPMRPGVMRLPAPGNRVLNFEIARGTVVKLDGHLIESPRGPRLSECKLRIEPPMVLTNLGDAFAPPEEKSGGLFGRLKSAATRVATAALQPPISGGTLSADGTIKIEVPLNGVDVGKFLPESFFKPVPMHVADWFKSERSARSVKAVAGGKPEADALDAAEAFARSVESALIEAYLSGVPHGDKRTELALQGTLQRAQDKFEGSLSVQGDLDSTIPVPAQGPTGILGAGVKAALQGTLSAKVDASLSLTGGRLSGTARNIAIDMNIASGSLIGDSVALALGRQTNVAIRAAALAVGPQGTSLAEPSVVANLDLGAGHITLDDAAFEVDSGSLKIGPSADTSMLADVEYALIARANANGKAEIDAAVSELQTALAKRAPRVSVNGSVKVEASL